MKTFTHLKLICLLVFSSCGINSSNGIEIPEKVPFEWADNAHFYLQSLGDTCGIKDAKSDTFLTSVLSVKTTQQDSIIRNINATVKLVEQDSQYIQLRSYYNALFDGSETDSSWAYWSFDVNQEPAELYLIQLDSNTLEINASILSYR